jgi:hypothetical protein
MCGCDNGSKGKDDGDIAGNSDRVTAYYSV